MPMETSPGAASLVVPQQMDVDAPAYMRKERFVNFVILRSQTRQLSYRKAARCAEDMGALKNFDSPHYAPGYFSQNL